MRLILLIILLGVCKTSFCQEKFINIYLIDIKVETKIVHKHNSKYVFKDEMISLPDYSKILFLQDSTECLILDSTLYQKIQNESKSSYLVVIHYYGDSTLSNRGNFTDVKLLTTDSPLLVYKSHLKNLPVLKIQSGSGYIITDYLRKKCRRKKCLLIENYTVLTNSDSILKIKETYSNKYLTKVLLLGYKEVK